MGCLNVHKYGLSMVGFDSRHMKQAKKESIADVVIIHMNMNQIQKQVGGGRGGGLKPLPLTTTLFYPADSCSNNYFKMR
jgi:hypothetical protein